MSPKSQVERACMSPNMQRASPKQGPFKKRVSPVPPPVRAVFVWPTPSVSLPGGAWRALHVTLHSNADGILQQGEQDHARTCTSVCVSFCCCCCGKRGWVRARALRVRRVKGVSWNLDASQTEFVQEGTGSIKPSLSTRGSHRIPSRTSYSDFY